MLEIRTSSVTFVAVLLLVAMATVTEAAENDTCSFHEYFTCDPNANCIDTDGVFETCICKSGYVGDGFRGDYHTGCELIGSKNVSCSGNDDCLEYNADCTDNVCQCRPGYARNDSTGICTDINECEQNRCDENANCNNIPGSFTCTCKALYDGDGFYCKQICRVDSNCHDHAKCILKECVCDTGYSGDGINCTDVNECETGDDNCHINADCTNNEGSFDCACKPGFVGDGLSCKVVPQTCDEILQKNSKSQSGPYLIDPDGTGPIPAVTVECDMRPDNIGVTIVKPVVDLMYVSPGAPDFNLEYTASVEQIRKIANVSGYCYQDVSAQCRWNAVMLGGNTYWVDGKGDKHLTWGGSSVDGMCPCGQLDGYCQVRGSNCNCDGSASLVEDGGKILDRNLHPVTRVHMELSGRQKFRTSIGPVVCSPKPFDIPKDCHEAKFSLGQKKDGALIIDIDGPDGDGEPVLVHCDMETYPHVGVTVVPLVNPLPTGPGLKPIEYSIENNVVQKIVDFSKFCVQEASYSCMNSDLNGFYFMNMKSQMREFFPGSMSQTGACPCALTGTCSNPAELCNCNVKDGVTRMDFGSEFEKENLPITAMYFNDIGTSANQNASYTLSALKCSQQSFSFEATCEGYLRDREKTYSYTYMVDPDGPEPVNGNPDNIPPFPVECQMHENPPHAVTVIHHESEGSRQVAGVLSYVYRMVDNMQLQKLIARSIYCTQSISYTCNVLAPVHDAAGDSIISWIGLDGNKHEYFHGQDGSSCQCGLTNTCEGPGQCNCDGTASTSDSGNLFNKHHLPALNVTFNDPKSSNSLNLGPLMCYEIRPTCSDLLWAKNNRMSSEVPLPTNTPYTIDPDGAGGEDPFVVFCKFPQTIISISPDGTNSTGNSPGEGVEKCFQITYNNGVSPAQIEALIERSAYCTQHLSYDCRNAPLTDHVSYKSCSGETQPGWGGSNGQDKCACGVTGTCSKGADSLCNCDNEDGDLHTDEGWIHNKTRLPVCEVCIKLDPVTNEATSRSASYKVTDLVCNSGPIGLVGSCQEHRDADIQESKTIYVDPDGLGVGNPPFPVYCRLEASPRTGAAEIRPRETEYPVPENGTVVILYFVFDLSYVVELVEESVYCEQAIYLLCGDAQVPVDGRDMDDWVQEANGTLSCKPGKCECNGDEVYGGYVVRKTSLPAHFLQLPEGIQGGTVYVKPMECYNVYKDCHEIKEKGAILPTKINPNSEYAIDPDGAGGVPLFGVVCDFLTDKTIGITQVDNSIDGNIVVSGYRTPTEYTVPIEYPNVTPEQIHTLANISNFCYQGIQYECSNIPAMRLTMFEGEQSQSVGTGYGSPDGCPCTLTGECPENQVCQCDAKGPMVRYDYGWVLDNDVMPIEEARFGPPQSDSEQGTAKISGVRCGPKPFDIPTDCEEAYSKGFKTGDILIMPSENVTPFFVYCDMELVPGHGVTVIGNDKDEAPIDLDLSNDTTINVTYNSVSIPQVEALTEFSKYCFIPVKYDCFATQFLGFDKFYWNGRDNKEFRYFGNSDNIQQECSCGTDNQCGGNQSEPVLLQRKCSCDSMESQWRKDGGVLSIKDHLPLRSMTFLKNEFSGAQGKINVGKLYCSQVEYNPNECELDIHDCHDLANCENTDGGFECHCPEGLQGIKRDPLVANGRNCYDNDECATGVCQPDRADCTNTFGSFTCTCHEGYVMAPGSKTVCNDINECENPDACSPHADCFNRPGSYVCRCKRGFRGDGFNCTSIGICSCFGDPHCLSFDGKWLHFQGDCQYTMATDGCDGNQPTFEIRSKHWNQNIPGLKGATWIEEVELILYRGGENTTVTLKQGSKVWYNRELYPIPGTPDEHIDFRRFGSWIQVYTSIGVRVNWDGYQAVEVLVPQSFLDTTCGLCGNYNMNPHDDWTIGDYCPTTGTITNNANIFGNSYVVPEYKEKFPHCDADCNAPEPPKPCTAAEKAEAVEYCNKLFLNKEFEECMAGIPKTALDGYILSCVDDLCLIKDNFDVIVCNHAKGMVKECSDNYGVVVTDWRTVDFCEPQCGLNMEYLYCGYPQAEGTCYDVESTSSPLVFNDTCRDGCFCRDGFVMDSSGNECVPKEDCGCMYKGRYYQVGEKFVTDNCEETWVCQDTHKFSKSKLKCHELSECKLKGGIYGCHCDTGYIMVDGVCIFDPCGSEPCKEMPDAECKMVNETYVCQCKMGFQGDCKNCEDIDECKTRTDNCTRYAECKNTPGSFTCTCRNGYKKIGEKCHDINECRDENVHKCPAGTKCFNTIGGFLCEPCSDNSPGNKCCYCKGSRCKEDGEVCGTDGKTYPSAKALIVARCEQDLKWHELLVNNFGHCKSSCNNTECPPRQTCVEEPGQDPKCVCDSCDETNPENTERPVCTDTFRMYPSMCAFIESMCNGDTDSEPSFDTSPCEEKRGSIPLGEWGPWSPCSTSCGIGEKSRTRERLDGQFYSSFNFDLKVVAKCYNDPCPDSPCIAEVCNSTEICMVDAFGNAVCECPDCMYEGYEPVCASIGGKQQSFRSPCDAQKEACESGEPVTILNEGHCGSTPVNCTLMPDFKVLRHEGCAKLRINKGKCSGGCGPFSNFCCNKVNTKMTTFVLDCGENDPHPVVEEVTESCECDRMNLEEE